MAKALLFIIIIPRRAAFSSLLHQGSVGSCARSAHLPVALSDRAEERDHPAPVGLCHGSALLQEQPADVQLPPARRRRQSCRGEERGEQIAT